MKLFKLMHACYEKDQIWCTAFHDPYLYNINLQTNEIKEVMPIIDNDELDSYIYITSYKNYLILVPSAQNKLIMMNRDTLQKEVYEIPFALQDLEVFRFLFYFINGFIHEDTLYLFGVSYAGIVKFDLIKKEFTLIDDFLRNLQVTSKNEWLSIFSYIHVEDSLYLPFANTNAVLEFSLNDESTKIHYVGDTNQRFICGAYDGKNIWLAPKNVQTGRIIKWNLETDNVTKYEDYYKKMDQKYMWVFIFSFRIKNFIVILSNAVKIDNDNNIKIDIETESMDTFPDLYTTYNNYGTKYGCCHVQDDIIFCIDGLDLIRYDFMNKKIERIPLTASASMLEHIEKTEVDKMRYIFKPKSNKRSFQMYEQQKANLNCFIEFLKN